ncbi:hypothetical protein [Sorangium sp. So ce1099]|uniref:hypothetical protein n=1 Tax=Sorangium sp. So ce1099 TaxID=3133331 RepID=UPI003F60F50D
MPSRAVIQEKPFHFHRSVHLVGSGFCSLLVLVACGQQERQFNNGGGADATGSGGGGSDATGSGGGGSDATGSGGGGSDATGSGGGVSCETRDPDCECAGGKVVARDVDDDGEGTRLCEAAAGRDCDDGDGAFVVNECGGCNKSLGGKVGDPCGSCGVFQCLGDSALRCAAPEPPPRQCAGNTLQVCADGQWTTEIMCDGALPACFNGACTQCRPGTFKCGSVQGTPVVIKCLETGSWESSWTSCSSDQTCNAESGTCVGMFHPRDIDFDVPLDVPPLLRDAPGTPAAPGLPTRDVLDLAVGIAFA